MIRDFPKDSKGHIVDGIMPTRSEILRLYKNLILYSKSLRFTNPVYFRSRISNEFRKNKFLTSSEEVIFAYKKGLALLNRGSVV
ncbi:mitochondrial ribosome and complex I assembly factor AltMIEF1-like isoform X2 [Achroia grisella]|uniref:mitochondrial ribosome and complex I assembly factor AltMIEF1-like isoform X2 n=1 Tax=Achroia grisella TaxID=688607 RepID=UPI0027D223FA|nr:mitochondrial ribosome and complex I assembly factor AltMIEF1-like isoform X2 [Achroia grisella]